MPSRGHQPRANEAFSCKLFHPHSATRNHRTCNLLENCANSVYQKWNRMELIIQGLSEKSQPVTVQPTATIGHLKQLIAPHFETTASRLNLSALGGQILDKDQLTVSQYGLSSGSTVMLLISTTPVSFQMFVKNVSGQTKMYDITEDETVDQLKTKVYQKEGTPEDQQRLVFNGKQLDSGRKLQDYGITSGSTIYLTLRLRGG